MRSLNSRIYLVVPWLLFIEFSEYDECFLNFKMAWKFAFVLAFSALLSGKNCLFLKLGQIGPNRYFWLVNTWYIFKAKLDNLCRLRKIFASRKARPKKDVGKGRPSRSFRAFLSRWVCLVILRPFFLRELSLLGKLALT